MKYLRRFNESVGDNNKYLDLIRDCFVNLSDRFVENGSDDLGIHKYLFKLDRRDNSHVGNFLKNSSIPDEENMFEGDIRVAYVVRFNLASNALTGKYSEQPGILNLKDIDVEGISNNFLLLSQELPEIKDRLSDIVEDITMTCQLFGRFEILIILNKEASKEVGW